MHMISRRTHGLLDYIVPVLLIASPKLFGFATGGPEEKIPMTIGVVALVYGLITKREFALIKVLPFPVHLTLDVMSALFLAASPWIFHFADQVWVPHVLLALGELGIVLLTSTMGSEPRLPPSVAAHR
jgi:hypothetical protein